MSKISRAIIVNGIWVRNVPRNWIKNGIVRTDIFKSVLADPRLKIAEYRIEDGTRIKIPKEELMKILIGGPDHYGRNIWGPFSIDLANSTLNGHKVKMVILNEAND